MIGDEWEDLSFQEYVLNATECLLVTGWKYSQNPYEVEVLAKRLIEVVAVC